MKKLVLLMVVAGLVFAANAATKTVDGVTYTYEGGVIYKIEGDAKIINIPKMLDGMNDVCWLQAGCMQNNTTVMKICIPDTVTTIGEAAFKGCLALTECNIQTGVSAIPNSCFAECTNLRTVSLPTGVKVIGREAFKLCKSLVEVSLPQSLQEIGDYAFDDCDSLRKFFMPDSVKVLGDGIFHFCGELETVHLSEGLGVIPYMTFWCCYKLANVNVPSGVEEIETNSFGYCPLKLLELPESVSMIGKEAFYGTACKVIFKGRPPAGLELAGIGGPIVYPREFGAQWRKFVPVSQFGGYINVGIPTVVVMTTKVREGNAMVLDVVYKVTSTKPTVKVRALAFEDGERSFAKVTRPETFIDGTAANLGDTIAANVEHKLSWQVSSDFKTDLAKMKFEVLAVEDGILPLEFITIPANGANKKMQLSWNLLTEAQVFDALLWLYADKDAGLTLTNGELRNGATLFASGANVNYSHNYISGAYVDNYYAMPYILSKMGFSVLSGDALTYANEMTRLGLNPSGIRQYAWRELDD